jgi:predicted nucleic acid-binding Zn ribbon protein
MDESERYLQDDYRRRRVPVPPTKTLGDAMSQLLARKGYAQVQTAAACTAAWRQAVGDKLAGQSRPGNVRRGVLEVLVANSSALHELSFVKVKVVKKLAALVPEQQIKDVKFRVGPLD